MAPTVLGIQDFRTGEEEYTHPLINSTSLTITRHADGNTNLSVDVDFAKKSLRLSTAMSHITLKSPNAEIPTSLKNSSQGQGTGYSKQKILFLAKAFIHASTDPIIGTSQKENQFFQQICNIWNQQIVNYNKQNISVEKFIPFTTQTKHSLKGNKIGQEYWKSSWNVDGNVWRRYEKTKVELQKNFPNTLTNSCGWKVSLNLGPIF